MQFMACLSLISGDWKVHLDRLRSNHPKTALFLSLWFFNEFLLLGTASLWSQLGWTSLCKATSNPSLSCKWYPSEEACRQERVRSTRMPENVWRKWSLNSRPQIFKTESWIWGLQCANRRAELPPHDCSDVTYRAWVSGGYCWSPPRQPSASSIFGK